jgi:hypothetical protein
MAFADDSYDLDWKTEKPDCVKIGRFLRSQRPKGPAEFIGVTVVFWNTVSYAVARPWHILPWRLVWSSGKNRSHCHVIMWLCAL